MTTRRLRKAGCRKPTLASCTCSTSRTVPLPQTSLDGRHRTPVITPEQQQPLRGATTTFPEMAGVSTATNELPSLRPRRSPVSSTTPTYQPSGFPVSSEKITTSKGNTGRPRQTCNSKFISSGTTRRESSCRKVHRPHLHHAQRQPTSCA